MYNKVIKRVLDCVVALMIFLIASPIFLFIIIFLTFANKGSAFFFQPRPGKNEKIFKVIKFKTMNDKKDNKGALLSDAERLTSVGKFIRKTSLDEIPQLLNVIKGDMSLIGPRPLLVRYLDRYNNEQKRRHNLKPGITGWAQVNGRNAISWDRKFELDVWYVDNISFLLDLKILLLTIEKVVKSDGVNSEIDATMSEFKGDNNIN